MSRPQPAWLQRLHQRQADHPRAHHHDGVVQRRRRAANRVQGDGERLDQGGVLERQPIRQPIENVLRHGHEFGKRAVLPVILAGDPQHSPMIAQVDHAAPAKLAVPAIDGRVEGDPVARRPAGHAAADAGDDARRLVPHDDGRPATARAAVHPVHVAAANAARFDGDEHFVRTGLRGRHVFAGELLVVL